MSKGFRFHGVVHAKQGVRLDDVTTISGSNGDIIFQVKDKELSVMELINRLEALEQAYMELLLLGKDNGND
jgi:hypothetical protein